MVSTLKIAYELVEVHPAEGFLIMGRLNKRNSPYVREVSDLVQFHKRWMMENKIIIKGTITTGVQSHATFDADGGVNHVETKAWLFIGCFRDEDKLDQKEAFAKVQSLAAAFASGIDLDGVTIVFEDKTYRLLEPKKEKAQAQAATES